MLLFDEYFNKRKKSIAYDLLSAINTNRSTLCREMLSCLYLQQNCGVCPKNKHKIVLIMDKICFVSDNPTFDSKKIKVCNQL